MSFKAKCNFTYHAPDSVQEALALLAQYGEEAKIIAGGTDLIPRLKGGVAQFSHLVSLKNLTELTGVTFDAQDGLTIGSMCRLKDVERDAAVVETYPALCTGIHVMANTQVRNRGTVAGNICNAIPSADTAPALLVYGASAEIVSPRGKRTVKLEEFFTGVCKTVLEPDEIMTAIHVPVPDAAAHSIYYKYTIRNGLDLAMVGVASNVVLDGAVVKDVKLALGAVAITPKRAYNAEQLILGHELTDELILEAARIASQEDCKPISDIRATADYRREMVRIHVRDALRLAVNGQEV